MQYIALGFLVVLAIGEYALTGRLSFGGCALVFVALRLQAERAADNFARYGKDGPPPPPWQQALPPEESAEEMESWLPPDYGQAGPEIKVAPLGGKGKQRHPYAPRSENGSPKPEAAAAHGRLLPFRAPKEAKREPSRAAPRTAPQSSAASGQGQSFHEPRFLGAPHEVLGIEKEAGTQVILRAFRHWIKKHHPDHAAVDPSAAGVGAADRARRLNDAKNSLLKTRARRAGKSAGF